ncbi:hypothetical protein [Chlorobium limicola]|nr:hypothetical protein [Chlorobium limicola]
MLYLHSSLSDYCLTMGEQHVYYQGGSLDVAAAADFSGVLLI